MARTTLQLHVARAEESVMKGELQIARQRKLIEDLSRDGHRTTEAVVVLERYEENHAKLIEDWEKLRAEQEAASA